MREKVKNVILVMSGGVGQRFGSGILSETHDG